MHASSGEEAPPALPSDRSKRRLGMTLSIFEGMSAQAQTCCCGLGQGGPNPITIGFAFLLGAKDPELALLAALPVAGSALQYVAAWRGPRLQARKPTVAIASVVARAAWLPIGAIPFFLSRSLGLRIFLALWFVTNALMALGGNLWISWIADLVPPGVRGRYFSRRNRATTVVSVLVPLALGFMLDHWFGGVPQPDAPLDPLQARGFAVSFGAAAFFGVLCYVLLVRQPELPRDLPPVPVHETWLEAICAFLRWLAIPFRDRRFRTLLAFVGAFGAANGLANPFWTPFQLQQLGLGYAYVNGWFIVLQGAAMALSLPIWGRLSDRFGNRPVIMLALVLIATHPYYYVFATKARWWLMFLDATSSGFAWAGYNLAIFNLVLALAPRDQRELYVATQAVVTGLLQAIASFAAGQLVQGLPAALPVGGLAVLDPRQQIFLVTAIARLACLGFFLGAVIEPRNRPIRSFVVAAHSYMKSRMGSLGFVAQDD